jgi:ABC-type multidrug transport system fused ATPase/permease subunit
LSEVAVLSLGLMWLAPELGLLPVLAGVVAVGVPLAMYPGLRDIDYAVRTQTGALWRFHFDALRGATAVHAHAAERVIASEHEAFLVEWLRAVRRFRGRSLACEVIVVATTLGLAALMVARLDGQLASGRALVVAFWALLIPTNALALVDTLLRFPERRNAAVRLIEPLDADEETSPPGDAAGSGSPSAAAPGGVEIVLDDVHVAIGGHDVLSGVELAIPPGQHIAVVGRSGAGKSSLFALLLGWYPPRAGRVLIDGLPSDPRRLRRDTAWVDPAIQLWRGTVMANVVYGADAAERSRLTDAIADGGLQRILLGLPKGLQTEIGEAGGRLSEGQGQRVRLARALMRSNARLVLLDEPFRGQDRAARQLLLQRIRERFRGATLLCVTHDIAEARGFDRVVVLEGGRICADGTPVELERAEDGAFAALLRADEALSDRVWGAAHWRRLEVRARTIRGAAGPAGAGGKDP